MLETLGAVGSFASGLGQLASGLGLGGGKFSRKKYHDQLFIQNKVMREQLPLNIAAYKEAGIHPLVGLGVQPNFQASPVYDDGVDLASAGQGIARAASVYKTHEERERQKVIDALALEEQAAKIDLLKAQATNIRSQSLPPAFPGLAPDHLMPGQGDARPAISDLVEQVASKAVSGASGRPGVEAGVSPATKKYDTPFGPIYGPSEELGESLEGLGPVAGGIAGIDVLLRAILPQYLKDVHAWWKEEAKAQAERRRAESLRLYGERR